MSIATNTSTTTFHDPSRIFSAQPAASIVRSIGAESAPGFAQVLHAFDPKQDESKTIAGHEADRKDELSERTEASDDLAKDDDAATPVSDASSDSADDDGAAADEAAQEAAGKTDQSGSAGQSAQNQHAEDSAAANGANPQAASDEQAATTSKAAVRLDLLVNRGDQAKLSIRGLVQSLRAQASPDLTAIAVQTRTGQIDQPAQPVKPIQSNQPQPATPALSDEHVKPLLAPPVPQSIGPAGRNPSDALSDQPPQSGRGPEDQSPRPLTKLPIQPNPNAGEIDPSSVDSQQTRSVRVDAVPSAGQTRPQVDFHRSGVAATVANVSSQARVDGAMTERAVKGVDAGVTKDAMLPLDPKSPKTDQLSSSAPHSVRASVMAQVQRGLASLLRSADGDMTLRLTPSHLGTVQISIKRDGERISLRMSASTPEARDMLLAGSKELSQNFETKGIKIENFEIDMQPADEPGSGDPTSGFASGHGDAHQQHQGHSQAPSGQSGDDIVPLEGQAGQHDISTSESIWSELGLDAVA